MMSDCPLAIRHKKGNYKCRGDFVVKGRSLMFWSCGVFRLYLGASFCIYIFFWLIMYSSFLIGLSMIGGDTLIVYVLVSHCLLIYINELFIICLYFVLCEIKMLFLFYLYFQ